jgi:hypothetical protein
MILVFHLLSLAVHPANRRDAFLVPYLISHGVTDIQSTRLASSLRTAARRTSIEWVTTEGINIAIPLTMMGEQRDQNDEWERHAEEQQQNRPHGTSPLPGIVNGHTQGPARPWQTAVRRTFAHRYTMTT